jgi:hypothetical protein
MKLITLLLFLFAIGCTPQENKSKYYNERFIATVCESGYEFVVFYTNSVVQILDAQGHGIPCVVERSK